MQNIFLALCLLVGVSQAQSVRGVITDIENKPLPDVHIRIVGTQRGTISDSEGRYVFEDFSTGATLHFSAVGYASKEAVVESGELNIILQPSVLVLNNAITITAQRYEASTYEVPQTVSVLGAAELKKIAPRTTPEALMGTTGVWIQKTNHGGGSPIMRGLVGNQILLLIDGIRLNNSTYRYGPNQYLSTIDPDLVERMEATRGSGSALYGSDALGGVVQVISRSPEFTNGGFKAGGAAFGKWMSAGMEKSGRAEVNLASKKMALLGGFSAKNYGDIHAGGTIGTLNPTGYTEQAGDLKLLVRSGANGLLTAAYQQHRQNEVPRYDQVSQGGYQYYFFDPQQRQLAYVRWNQSTTHPIVDHIQVTGSFQRSTEGVSSQRLNSTDVRRLKDVVDTWGFISEMHSTIKGYWSAQSGMEFYHDFVTSNASNRAASGVETVLRGSYADQSTLDNLALFSNHTMSLRKFEITAGGRWNGIRASIKDGTFGNQIITPTAFVWNAGITYPLNQFHRLVLTANSGFRAPNIDDISKFGSVEATVFEVPSVRLSPERSLNMELGLRTKSDLVSSSLSVYRMQLKDLIDRVPVVYEGKDTIENRRVYQKQNVGSAFIYGAEAEAEVKLYSSLVAYGNITYTYGENTSKQEPLRRIPPLFGKAGIRYRSDAGWWARVEWISAGDQTRLAKGDLSDARISVRLKDGIMPGWSVVNISVGYRYRKIEFANSFQNVFNRGYRMYGSGVDGVGRSIHSSVCFRF